MSGREERSCRGVNRKPLPWSKTPLQASEAVDYPEYDNEREREREKSRGEGRFGREDEQKGLVITKEPFPLWRPDPIPHERCVWKPKNRVREEKGWDEVELVLASFRCAHHTTVTSLRCRQSSEIEKITFSESNLAIISMRERGRTRRCLVLFTVPAQPTAGEILQFGIR